MNFGMWILDFVYLRTLSCFFLAAWHIMFPKNFKFHSSFLCNAFKFKVLIYFLCWLSKACFSLTTGNYGKSFCLFIPLQRKGMAYFNMLIQFLLCCMSGVMRCNEMLIFILDNSHTYAETKNLAEFCCRYIVQLSIPKQKISLSSQFLSNLGMSTVHYFRAQMEIYVVGSAISHGAVIFLVENTCHPRGRKRYY